MKRLVLVCGANGVGKSAACKELFERLPGTAYIDSDYCRFMNPFSFSRDEIAVIVSNISTMMINYFSLDTIHSVVFQYGFHGPRQAIFNSILKELSDRGIKHSFCPVILECALEENIRRMRKDGRDEERIRRAVENTRPIYANYGYPLIDTTNLSAPQAAEQIMRVLETVYPL